MRLSKERFEMIKNADCSKSCADCKLSGCYSNQELIDEIEALQKENNGWQERYYELDTGHSRLFKDFCKLQKENEQLRAQVARMREALQEFVDTANILTGFNEAFITEDSTYWKFKKILETISTDYHNPADVAALWNARTAINNIIYTVDYYIAESEIVPNEMHKRHIDEAKEVLAEIDKVIGGNADV